MTTITQTPELVKTSPTQFVVADSPYEPHLAAIERHGLDRAEVERILNESYIHIERPSGAFKLAKNPTYYAEVDGHTIQIDLRHDRRLGGFGCLTCADAKARAETGTLPQGRFSRMPYAPHPDNSCLYAWAAVTVFLVQRATNEEIGKPSDYEGKRMYSYPATHIPAVQIRRDRLARIKRINPRVWSAVLALAPAVGADLVDSLIAWGEQAIITQISADLTADYNGQHARGRQAKADYYERGRRAYLAKKARCEQAEAQRALANIQAKTSAGAIGEDIKRMLGQPTDATPEPEISPAERQARRERAYAAALRPDTSHRPRYEFEVRHGGGR